MPEQGGSGVDFSRRRIIPPHLPPRARNLAEWEGAGHSTREVTLGAGVITHWKLLSHQAADMVVTPFTKPNNSKAIAKLNHPPSGHPHLPATQKSNLHHHYYFIQPDFLPSLILLQYNCLTH